MNIQKIQAVKQYFPDSSAAFISWAGSERPPAE